MTRPRIVVIGAGGHARVVLDILFSIGAYEVVGVVALDGPSYIGRYNIAYLGKDDVLPALLESGEAALAALGVGTVGDNHKRKDLFTRVKAIGYRFPPLIHPRAVVGGDLEQGEGLVVAAGATVNPGVICGTNVLINTGAVVDHDCRLGDHVHVAPGAVLCGGVRVGDTAHVGAGATIIQGLTIGEGAVVGAGAVVVRDVAPWTVVAGNPARVLRVLRDEA